MSHHADKKIIEELGGASKLARKLGCSPQRVHNWKTRGIPASVKLDNLKLFYPNQYK